MEDIPEIYYMESLEQLRGVADELRMRIMGLVAGQAMTVTDIARLLQEAPGKIHYHVRELERLGLIRLVETREKGGILEKYYRAIALNFSVPRQLLRTTPADETTEAITASFQGVFTAFMRALQQALKSPDDPAPAVGYSVDHFWMTEDEYRQIYQKISDTLKPYEIPRGIDGEKERTFATFSFNTLDGRPESDDLSPEAEGAQSAGQTIPSAPHHIKGIKPINKPHHVRAVGAISLNRDDLERAIAEDRLYDIAITGYCRFADDISPELADRAITSFRCMGKLDAPPAVREVLERKKL
jgi:DNA-binding transcriptional ArsR family regulator